MKNYRKEATVSEVPRHNGLDADPEGAFVYHDEYIALRDERDRLRDELDVYRQAVQYVFEAINKFEDIQRKKATLTPAGQRWTRNKPTEPGWYWHKHAATGLMGVALIEQRTASTTGNFLFCSFLSDDGLSSACVLTKIKDGEWQGPLSPNEATE